MWYVAHSIVYIELQDSARSIVTVYENMLLVSASSFKHATELASEISKKAEGDDEGSLTWNGEAAKKVFGGIRKIVLCENPSDPPQHGDELTYNEIVVDDRTALKRLIDGDMVVVTLDGIGEQENS